MAADRDPVALAPFYRSLHLRETASTNDDAKRLAAEGAAEGTLVWADAQTAGRGRRGRRWQSPAGNLYGSLILRPPVPIAMAGQIGFAAALAITDALIELLPLGAAVSCKWPNDVLIGGRKAAGLLLETAARPDGATAWLVVGLGINVASHPAAVEFPATSLAAAGGTASVVHVLAAFCRHFLDRYVAWRDRGFAALRADWLARAAGLGQPIRVRLDDRTLEGTFAGLDEEGALLLHSANSGDRAPLRITAGDVFFPPSTARAG